MRKKVDIYDEDGHNTNDVNYYIASMGNFSHLKSSQVFHRRAVFDSKPELDHDKIRVGLVHKNTNNRLSQLVLRSNQLNTENKGLLMKNENLKKSCDVLLKKNKDLLLENEKFKNSYEILINKYNELLNIYEELLLQRQNEKKLPVIIDREDSIEYNGITLSKIRSENGSFAVSYIPEFNNSSKNVDFFECKAQIQKSLEALGENYKLHKLKSNPPPQSP